MPLTGNGVRFPVAEPLLGVYDGRMLGNVNSIRDMDPTSMAFALDFWLPAAAAKILHQITPTLRSPISDPNELGCRSVADRSDALPNINDH